MANENRSGTKVQKRDEVYTQRVKTKIWHEQASEQNPYVAQQCRIHGYELTELSKSLSFTESIYLNIRGELPSNDNKVLMDALFVALSNLGPRHPATRAVMSAAVSKTQVSHLLPIGLSILSGDHFGANEVEKAVKFIRKNINKPPETVAQDYLNRLQNTEQQDTQDQVITPGFGTRFGDIDIISNRLAQQLSCYAAADRALRWGSAFSDTLNDHGQGWLLTGVAAACFVDLGFTPKASAGLFQLAAAPGLLAHGLELATKPITAMPFVEDTDYEYIKKSE
jgi:citrate synthase